MTNSGHSGGDAKWEARIEMIVPFSITICGLEELPGHCEVGVSHVVSILDPEWPVPAAFGAFGEHTKLELRFHDVIDAHHDDVITPQAEHVGELLAFARHLRANAHLLVHCHAGVSRSTASMAVILAQACPDVPGTVIFEEVLRKRPRAWPNLRIVELGDALLGWNGALIAAAVEVYRRQLANRQYVAEEMRSGGRSREVDVAASGPCVRA